MARADTSTASRNQLADQLQNLGAEVDGYLQAIRAV
jgi:hypothetical protein